MFLNPLMLAGLAAIAVPIIIHLLNRRKFERVVWAAMRFLRVSVEQNQRRIQVEDILLLIVRCALLALLALALARPVARGAAALFGPGKVCAVILLDNSASMSQTDGVQSRFDAAKKAAEQVIGTFPEGSSAAVMLVSNVVENLIAEPTFELPLATQTIREAPLYDRPTNVAAGFKAAVELLKGRPAPRREIYLVTDGQASGWRQMDSIRTMLQANKEEIRAHIVLVGKSEDRNVGVTSLRVDSGLCPVNQPVRMEVRAQNYGRSPARDLNIALAVDNDPPMDQATLPVLEAGEERGVAMFARLKNEGHHTITARIDADHVPADDSRSVAVRAVKSIRLLLIDGDPGREERDSEVFFLKHALRPVPRSQWDDYYIKLAVKLPTELDGIRFEDFDAVVSANVTDFSAATVAQLVTYVNKGGGLMVFPGDSINTGFYNEQLYRKHKLLPASFGPTRGDAKTQEKWFALSDKAHEHDIVSLWQDPAAGVLSSARFFKAVDLLPSPGESGEAKKEAPRVVVRFADGKPAMVERDFGQGRVIQFASTACTKWNDLPARAGIFLPLMHRTLGYLVARQDEHLTIPVGGEFIHTAPIELVNKDALLIKPARPYSHLPKDQNEVYESQRIELTGGAAMLRFAKVNYAGTYTVRVGETTVAKFAAQADPDESSIDMLTGEQEKLIGDVARIIKWTPGMSLGETMKESAARAELWPLLIVLALVIAASETLLAHWFSKSK